MPEPLTLITYQFLHGGWLHLISNMLFLWVFADNVEDAFGHVGFLIFYLLCGHRRGARCTRCMQPASPAPLIGASGAVSGVLAAYLLLYPKARVWILLFMRIPLRISGRSGRWAAGSCCRSSASSSSPRTIDRRSRGGRILAASCAGLILTFLLRSRLLVRPAET